MTDEVTTEAVTATPADAAVQQVVVRIKVDGLGEQIVDAIDTASERRSGASNGGFGRAVSGAVLASLVILALCVALLKLVPDYLDKQEAAKRARPENSREAASSLQEAVQPTSPGFLAAAQAPAVDPEQEMLAKAFALVQFYIEPKFESDAETIPSSAKQAERVRTGLKREVEFFSNRYEHFGDWDVDRRAALLFWSYDVRVHRGRGEGFEAEFRNVLIALGDESWRNSQDAGLENENYEGRFEKWSQVAALFAASPYALEEAPFRAYRIKELLLGQTRFHRSILNLGRTGYCAAHAQAHPWFAALSPARQRAVMELTLWRDVTPVDIGADFPRCCAALSVAVRHEAAAKEATDDAERQRFLSAAQSSYEMAAEEAGPDGGRCNREEPVLCHWFAQALAGDRLID